MKAVLTELDARFRAPMPALRLATLRALVGAFTVGYLLARAPVLIDFRSFDHARFEPVGLCAWLNAPLPQAFVLVAYLVTLALSFAFTLGLRFRVTGVACALGFTWVASYRNSWGMIFHTENLLVFHLWVIACSDAAAALALDARARATTADAISGERFGWPVRLLCAVSVSSYVLAGMAKLEASGLPWMEGEILRNYIAYDALRKAAVGSIYSPLGAWLVQYAWPFRPIGALTLLLELAGPLCLLHRGLGRVWALGIYGFHVGVLATMAIAFPYPLSGIAFASFFECERIWKIRGLSAIHAWLSPAGLRAQAAGVR